MNLGIFIEVEVSDFPSATTLMFTIESVPLLTTYKRPEDIYFSHGLL